MPEVPDEWLQAAFNAIGHSGTGDGDDQVRRVVAALLPLMRERIALNLERQSSRLDQDGERCADERSPRLEAKAEALWDAARQIRAGQDGDDDA
jgi:hypothetical protein